jgi:hypothetical protein
MMDYFLRIFHDTKEVIRSHKSKDRQYNGQKKKGQTMIYKTLEKTKKLRNTQEVELGCSRMVSSSCSTSSTCYYTNSMISYE